jgi:hypothetical protein
MTTPSRRQTIKVSTPGSAASEGDASGVPWHVKKLLAQEIEKRFPLNLCPEDSNSVAALLNSGTQPLSQLLDNLVAEDPENNQGAGVRGDRVRTLNGDLIQTWKMKTKEEYLHKVVVKHGVKQEPSRKPRYQPKDKKVEGSKEADEIEESFTSPQPKRKNTKSDSPIIGSRISAAKQETSKLSVTSTTSSTTGQSKGGSSSINLLSDGTLEGMCT